MSLNPPQDFRSTDKTHRIGLATDKPAATDVLPGTLYFSTDDATLERSDGATWSTYGASGGEPMGPEGPGEPGPQGPIGLTGPAGLFGIDGEDGFDGFDGFPGSTGIQGVQGIQGIQGIPGEQGIPGTGGGSVAVLLAPFVTEAEEVVESAPLFPSIIIPPPGLRLYNSEIVTPGAGFAVDTYLAGSRILMPATYPKVGSRYRLRISVSKTAAGAAAAVFTVRYGLAGAIGDASRFVFTFGIQTAAIDTGIFELAMHFRVAGAVAVLAGFAKCDHHLAATGLTNTGVAGTGIIIPAPSAPFDATPVNSFIGVSLNAGSLAAWTIVVVESELEG